MQVEAETWIQHAMAEGRRPSPVNEWNSNSEAWLPEWRDDEDEVVEDVVMGSASEVYVVDNDGDGEAEDGRKPPYV